MSSSLGILSPSLSNVPFSLLRVRVGGRFINASGRASKGEVGVGLALEVSVTELGQGLGLVCQPNETGAIFAQGMFPDPPDCYRKSGLLQVGKFPAVGSAAGDSWAKNLHVARNLGSLLVDSLENTIKQRVGLRL